MKKVISIWISILLTGLVGCGDNRNARLLADAEACMETRADSAQWLLQQTDSAMTDEQQACYALLWTQATHKCHLTLGSDSLINVAVKYYSGTNDRHRLAKSLLYKGLVHKQLGEVEQAVESFVASEQAFEGVDDNQYKALLFNHYALLLMEQNLLDLSLEYYKKSYMNERRGDSVHYVVTACCQIAKIYELKNIPDSANSYYKLGIEYTEQCKENKRARMCLQNYAAFLISREEYANAEQLLKNSEQSADSTYIHNVYSSFATLYYEKGEYKKVLSYGEKMLESQDSLMQCVGFLHLYRAYKQLGNLEKAVHYHDLYRRYDSDLTLRRRTATVAAIPHKLVNRQLLRENRTAHRWLWVWGIGLSVVLVSSIYIIRYMKRKQGTQMKEKDSLLAEKESLLEEIEGKLYDLKIESGRMKGALANQTKAMCSLREERQRDKEAYNESVKELKRTLKEKDEEYKKERKAVQYKFSELTRRVNQSEKEQMRWNNELKELTEQMGLYELLQRFLLDGGNIRVVILMLELKSGTHNRRYTIRRADYAVLLKQLADYAYPGIRHYIETDDELKNKQELASLLALGIDDMDMLRTATNLQPNSVRAYRTQVKKALDTFLQKEH